MIRDITVGQFYPVDSVIHKLDPRVKIIITFLYIISLFTFRSFTGFLIATLFLYSVIYSSKVPFGYIMRGLKSILFLLIFTAFFNMFWTPGDVIFHYGIITLTRQGLRSGIFMSLRLIYLIIGSSMMTFTTTPNHLTDGLESIFKPLGRLHVPVHDLAMMISLALRFIPILIEEANKIMNAQSARGADFEEGKMINRMKNMVSILVPLLISATRRAGDLAIAMEARCYRGGEGRTKMKPLNYKKSDIIAYLVSILYFVILVVLSRVFVF